MKAEIISKNNGKAVIELTIDTDRELCDLFHRVNVSAGTVNNESNLVIYKADNHSCSEFFNVLRELADERDLYEK